MIKKLNKANFFIFLIEMILSEPKEKLYLSCAKEKKFHLYFDVSLCNLNNNISISSSMFLSFSKIIFSDPSISNFKILIFFCIC